MSDTPDPGAPRDSGLFHSVIAAVPGIALAAGFLAMIFHAVPDGNKDLVGNVMAGLLGYLTHAAVSRTGEKAPAQATPTGDAA